MTATPRRAASPAAPARAYRIGIDVGGTFTKAVLIDNATHAVVGRYSVLTTHAHARGVAAGVVEVFRQVLATSGVSPDEVVFLAHSTTQATNALLEGDVAPVGVIGMAGANAAKLAEPQVHVGTIELTPGRRLETANSFIVAENVTDRTVADAISALTAAGARVLVASAAFGVDNTESEEVVRRQGDARGLMTTCGHEITRLYGLAVRTRTAVINASILPRMIETASMTEASVREAGITAPLMIMRGDGGVMDIREMRRRPVMTMLSGPAASVAGALMHLRVADGIYFEVGGTSTNIGVIRNGRPTVTYARVGGHETYVSSLDVRVLGIAGGSLIRAVPGRLVDVGPRSAHIAGLPYAAFAKAGDFEGARIAFFEPKPGDGSDYVSVRTTDGRAFALTTTCAANVLGYVKPGDHAFGNPAAARAAFAQLAALLATTVEDAARTVLATASAKIEPVVKGLIEEYDLDTDQCLLIGEGGGAAALLPFAAERLALRHEISRDAEVISSIGVALALVRDVVERIVPHPKPEDLQAIRQEAIEAAIRLGADRTGIDVTVEIDPLTHRVRATAVGAAEMRIKEIGGAIPESEARRIAANAMSLPADSLRLVAATAGFRAYQAPGSGPRALRVVDREGTLRIQRRSAVVHVAPHREALAALAHAWSETAGGSTHAPAGLFLLLGTHLVDCSGLETLAQAEAIARAEIEHAGEAPEVVIVAVPARAGETRDTEV